MNQEADAGHVVFDGKRQRDQIFFGRDQTFCKHMPCSVILLKGKSVDDFHGIILRGCYDRKSHLIGTFFQVIRVAFQSQLSGSFRNVQIFSRLACDSRGRFGEIHICRCKTAFCIILERHNENRNEQQQCAQKLSLAGANQIHNSDSSMLIICSFLAIIAYLDKR